MNLLKLLAISFLLVLFTGCAERKPIEVKEFQAEGLRDFLEKMKFYESVEGVLNLQYEDKRTIQGDAFVRISDRELLLRLYYLGFPAGEVYEENGEITSNLMIEKDRLKQLIIGIRKGFLWWNGDFILDENSDSYLLKDKNTERTVFLHKTTFMPLRQIIRINNHIILIEYDSYREIQAQDGTLLRMPMHLSVLYRDRWLKINFEKITLKNVKEKP